MKTEYIRSRLFLGASSIIGILIFLSIVTGLQYIVVKNPARWDITQEKQHTLSPQSLKITGQYREQSKPVEIMAFVESKDQRARTEASDLFDRYRDVWSGLGYTFLDPDRERAVALQNKVDSYPTFLIKSGDKTERLNSIDEEALTNALVRLQRDDVKKIYFLKGHGELSSTSAEAIGFSIARNQIEKQNYKTDDLILLQSSEVPTDATVLVIAGPRTDLMPEELKAIERFLHRGGSLLVMMNPFQTADLARELSKYGFSLTDDIVVDKMSQALGGDYLMPVITSYAQFPITKNFELASFFPQTRSVRILEKLPDTTKAVELAYTSPVSWTISESQLLSGSAEFDEKSGRKGPIPVMAVSTISTPEKVTQNLDESNSSTNKETSSGDQKTEGVLDEPLSTEKNKLSKTARVVVFGSSQFASNKFYKLQGNGDLFMNTISWLAEDENLISIRPKSVKAQPVVLTAQDSLIALVVPVILTPLTVVLAGIVVFVYRRRISV